MVLSHARVQSYILPDLKPKMAYYIRGVIYDWTDSLKDSDHLKNYLFSLKEG